MTAATGAEGAGADDGAGAGGEQQGGWQTLIESLPEDIRGSEHLTRHGGFEPMAREFLGLTSAVGKKGVLLPKEDDPKDIARWLKEIGRPDSASDYSRGDFKPTEGMPWDEEVERKLTQLCHDSGVSQPQYEKLLAGFAKIQDETFNATIQAGDSDYQERMAELKKEFGGDLERRQNLCSRAMKHLFGSEEAVEAITQARLADGRVVGNMPGFIKGMMAAIDLVGEDRLLGEGERAPAGAMTPEKAKAAIKEKEADKGFMAAYLNTSDPGHAAANAEMATLYAQAHPDGETRG
jgi:hypothetical protein